jgi:hypothetical protein
MPKAGIKEITSSQYLYQSKRFRRRNLQADTLPGTTVLHGQKGLQVVMILLR